MKSFPFKCYFTIPLRRRKADGKVSLFNINSMKLFKRRNWAGIFNEKENLKEFLKFIIAARFLVLNSSHTVEGLFTYWGH